MVLKPKTGVENVPRTDVYFPVGLPPMQRKPGEHFIQSVDALNLVRRIAEVAPGACILVADPFSNFKKGNITDDQAREAALRVAEGKQVFWQALASIVEEETGVEVPVYIMSEVVDRDEVDALIKNIWDLIDENGRFAEMVYSCVPDFWLNEVQKNSAYSQLTGRNLNKAKKRMSYVVEQIALVMDDKTKLGHDGEDRYNHVTREASKLLCRPCPRFVNIVPGEGNPYRAMRARFGNRMRGVLSASGLNFEPYARDLEKDKWAPGFDLLEYEERGREDRDSLAKSVAFIKDLYSRMVSISTHKPELREVIAEQICREVVMCLDAIEHRPYFHHLFEASGVLDVLRGMEVSELDGRGTELPFECPMMEGESESAYFVRYVNRLIHDDGPVVSGFQHGPLSELTNMLCELEGVGPNHYPLDERYAAWREQFHLWWRRLDLPVGL